MKQWLIATRNRGKLAEFRSLLAPLGIELLSPEDAGLEETPDEDALEASATFEENARAKAHWFCARSGLPTLADDSGLEVAALNGGPGVRSKRFAGLDGADHQVSNANNAALLARLRDIPAANREARYRCVLALSRPDAPDIVVSGETSGRILEAPQGGGGFGYDPLFWSDELQMSFGEAAAAAKDAVSHRGRAVRALAELLRRG